MGRGVVFKLVWKYTGLEHRQTLKSWLWKRLELYDWLCESTATSFVFDLATIGTFFHFLDPSEHFFCWGQVQKPFLDLISFRGYFNIPHIYIMLFLAYYLFALYLSTNANYNSHYATYTFLGYWTSDFKWIVLIVHEHLA